MKKIFLFLIFICITVCLTACTQESYILFNKHPITEETINSDSNTNIFKPGERIYYLVTTPKTVKTKRLLIQVFKLGDQDRLGYELVWGKQVKVRDEQVYYYTSYIVMNATGAYQMRVYSKDEPTILLTLSQFYVKN